MNPFPITTGEFHGAWELTIAASVHRCNRDQHHKHDLFVHRLVASCNKNLRENFRLSRFQSFTRNPTRIGPRLVRVHRLLDRSLPMLRSQSPIRHSPAAERRALSAARPSGRHSVPVRRQFRSWGSPPPDRGDQAPAACRGKPSEEIGRASCRERVFITV